MADIFSEVNEEVRREQLKRLWDRYGLFIVAAAVLVVVGVGAWRAYQWYEARKAAEAGAAYNAAAQLAQDGKPTEATAAFAQLATSGTPAYRTLARLREAEVMATRDSAAAVAIFDEVAANSGARSSCATLRRFGQVLSWSTKHPTPISAAVSSRWHNQTVRFAIPRASYWRSLPGAAAIWRRRGAGPKPRSPTPMRRQACARASMF